MARAREYDAHEECEKQRKHAASFCAHALTQCLLQPTTFPCTLYCFLSPYHQTIYQSWRPYACNVCCCDLLPFQRKLRRVEQCGVSTVTSRGCARRSCRESGPAAVLLRPRGPVVTEGVARTRGARGQLEGGGRGGRGGVLAQCVPCCWCCLLKKATNYVKCPFSLAFAQYRRKTFPLGFIYRGFAEDCAIQRATGPERPSFSPRNHSVCCCLTKW